MKIKSVEIKEDRVLKNIGISFENNGNILNTIVIAGANGRWGTVYKISSGKSDKYSGSDNW